MALVEFAITRVHDYMAVTVKVTKINGKMNFDRWTLAITAVPTTLTSRFPTTGYSRVMYFIFIRRKLGGTGTGYLFHILCARTKQASCLLLGCPCSSWLFSFSVLHFDITVNVISF